MKRFLASASVIIATAGAGLATTAAEASAAPHSEAASAVSHVSTTRDFLAVPGPWVVYGRYSSMAECTSVGANGELHGRWLRWTCYDNRPIDVQLWVQYS
jgi:hypothetical protein